jgi:hypothetical protein
MPRAVTTQDESDFSKRLLKSIPSEIVGTYIAINGLLTGNPENPAPASISWAVFAVLLGLCPIWLRFGQDVRKVWQLVVSTIAFVIWAMTLPGAFSSIPHAPMLGGVLIIIFSGIVAPLVAKSYPKQV